MLNFLWKTKRDKVVEPSTDIDYRGTRYGQELFADRKAEDAYLGIRVLSDLLREDLTGTATLMVYPQDDSTFNHPHMHLHYDMFDTEKESNGTQDGVIQVTKIIKRPVCNLEYETRLLAGSMKSNGGIADFSKPISVRIKPISESEEELTVFKKLCEDPVEAELANIDSKAFVEESRRGIPLDEGREEKITVSLNVIAGEILGSINMRRLFHRIQRLSYPIDDQVLLGVINPVLTENGNYLPRIEYKVGDSVGELENYWTESQGYDVDDAIDKVFDKLLNKQVHFDYSKPLFFEMQSRINSNAERNASSFRLHYSEAE